MASFRFPVFASGLIVIVSADGSLAPGSGRQRATAAARKDERETTTWRHHTQAVWPLPAAATPTSRSAPIIRTIGLSDLQQALRLGWEDFKAVPSHAMILCVIYPVLGLVLARTVLGYSVLPLLFPLAAGFALLGPFAALGLYELSRRRESGEQASAWDAVEVLRSPSFGAMLGLGVLLLALFVTWVATAQAIYVAAFGYEAAAGIPDFANARADHAARMVADRRRLRYGFPVRRGGVVYQRGVISTDARSPRQRRRCHGDVASRGCEKPGADGSMGIDRRSAAGFGIAAVRSSGLPS